MLILGLKGQSEGIFMFSGLFLEPTDFNFRGISISVTDRGHIFRTFYVFLLLSPRGFLRPKIQSTVS